MQGFRVLLRHVAIISPRRSGIPITGYNQFVGPDGLNKTDDSTLWTKMSFDGNLMKLMAWRMIIMIHVQDGTVNSKTTLSQISNPLWDFINQLTTL